MIDDIPVALSKTGTDRHRLDMADSGAGCDAGVFFEHINSILAALAKKQLSCVIFRCAAVTVCTGYWGGIHLLAANIPHCNYQRFYII